MDFFVFSQNQLAHVIEGEKIIDVVIVRDTEDDGQRITVQSLQIKPGVMEEFLYLPQGNVNVYDVTILVHIPGWRLLFWTDGHPLKCLNPNGPIYGIRPIEGPNGTVACMQ